jgi:hypothetical protein
MTKIFSKIKPFRSDLNINTIYYKLHYDLVIIKAMHQLRNKFPVNKLNHLKYLHKYEVDKVRNCIII